LQAYVLGQRSHLSSDLWQRARGDGEAGGTSTPLELLDEAHAAAGGSSSPWLRTWLSARRAEEDAIRGDARAALGDLDKADRHLGTATATDDAFFAHWYESPAAHLAAYRGGSMLELERITEATTIIQNALAALSPSLVLFRSCVLVDHSCALLAESPDLCSDRRPRPACRRDQKVSDEVVRRSGRPSSRRASPRSCIGSSVNSVGPMVDSP
jgi:hypothetical protein